MEGYISIEAFNDTIEAIKGHHEIEIADMRARYKKSDEIRKKEGYKAEYRKNTPFLMVYGENLNQVDLTDSELALLFTMGLHMGFKVKYVRDGDGRKNLNQQGITNLMGWTSESYASELLKSLTAKGAIIRDDRGNDAYYQLNPKYLHRGKHDGKTFFSKIFIKPVRNILLKLDKNSRALLLKMATSVDADTNFLVDGSGKRLRQAGVMRLMGWKNKKSTTNALNKLEEYGVIAIIEKNYLVNPQYIFVGEDLEAWRQHGEIKRVLEKGTTRVSEWCNWSNSSNAYKLTDCVA